MGTTAEKLSDAKVTLANLRKEVEHQEWVVEQLTHKLATEQPWGWVATYEEDGGKLCRQEVYAVAEGLRVRVEGGFQVIPIPAQGCIFAKTDCPEYASSSYVGDGDFRCLDGDNWLAFRRANADFPEVWELEESDED